MQTHLKTGIAGGIMLLTLALLALSAITVRANPSYFYTTSGSSATACSLTATSTRTWQTFGKGTTTVLLNAAGCGTSGQALDSAAVTLYRLGAGGGTKTKITLEYSPNCDATNGGDWYAMVATTTPAQYGPVTTGQDGFTWNFASSTIGGAVGASDFDTLLIPIATPVKCVRAVLAVPAGAASSSIWASIIGKRENN